MHAIGPCFPPRSRMGRAAWGETLVGVVRSVNATGGSLLGVLTFKRLCRHLLQHEWVECFAVGCAHDYFFPVVDGSMV